MCEKCEIVEKVIEVAPNNAHYNYGPTIELIKELVKQDRLILYAGDCELDDIDRILGNEEHYTVCHYFKCTNCNKTFFVGACIRGTPIFRSYEKIDDNEIKKLLWGCCGILE